MWLCWCGRPRLAQLRDQGVTAILARPDVGEGLSGQVCQAEDVIEIPKGEQFSVGRHARTVEFELRAGIERDPERAAVSSSPAAPSISSSVDVDYSVAAGAACACARPQR